MREDNRSTRTNVSPERFITVFKQAAQEGKSTQWVADQLNMHRFVVSNRASRYRKYGVDLPRLHSAKNPDGRGTRLMNRLTKNDSINNK